MSDLSIRESQPEDVPLILEVLTAALGEPPLLKRTPRLWAWKHELSPFGRSIVLLAFKGTRLAGVRAFMRWDLWTPRGEQVRCVRAVDTATHPEFARQGIFRRLTMQALDAAREHGIDMIFNTPNEKSRPGYLKMGWRDVGPIGVMVRPRVGGRAETGDDPERLTEAVLPGLKPFTPVAAPDRNPLGLRTRRTPEYQEWRFAGHPSARYALVEEDGGIAVVRAGQRKGRTEAVLSDLLGEARRGAVVKAARSHRGSYLAGFFSKGSPERAAAGRAGMLLVPGMTALHLVARPLSDLSFDPFDLRYWDIATSDLELL